MAEFSMFWTTGTTGDGTNPYTESQLFSWLRRTFNSDRGSSGPLKGYNGELAVTAGTGSVTVGTGAAYVYGIPYENDAPLSVPIPTPTANTRQDRIVLRATWSAKTVRITRLAGTEGAGAPNLTQNPGTIYEVPLALVTVTTGGAITVTDERQFCRFATEVATENLADGAVTGAKIAGGPGSGVHADMLDGQHLSDLDSRYVNVSGDTMTGALVVDNDVGSDDSRTYYNLASYKYDGWVTGTMKITLPKSWSDTMMRIRIVGYDYSGNAGWEVIVSGYNSMNPAWLYTAAELRGNTPFSTVRLAHTSGGHNCILLGNTTTEWKHPHVVVSEMLASHWNITGWNTGWSIDIITNEGGITNITTPPIRKFWHSGNVGPNSGLDADTVDGLEASALLSAGALVKRTTAQGIPNNEVTAVTFNTEVVDTCDCFDPNQPDRITVPTSGVYHVWGQVRWAANTNGIREIHIHVEGTGSVIMSRMAAQSDSVNQQTGGIWYLPSGQIVKLRVYQNSGGNLNIEPYNGQYITLGVFRIR